MGVSRVNWPLVGGGEKLMAWNPMAGCSSVSPGCDNCWARTFLKRVGQPTAVTLHPERLEEPLRWRTPRTVAVCLLGDLFHEAVPDTFIEQVVITMNHASDHTFMLLTKRPIRMRRFGEMWAQNPRYRVFGWPLPNVWLGVTAENQARADERIPLLLETPAARRFVSLEPLLGEIDLFCWLPPYGQGWTDRPNLDFVIVGGESGPHARRCHAEWIRQIIRQCQAAAVPVWVKQVGTSFILAADDHGVYSFRDRKGEDMSEWPKDLRVRQTPKGASDGQDLR